MEGFTDVRFVSVVRNVIAGKRGVGTYNVKSTEMLVAYVPIQPAGWGVVVHLPIADANAPAVHLRNLILIVVIASATIAGPIGGSRADAGGG